MSTDHVAAAEALMVIKPGAGLRNRDHDLMAAQVHALLAIQVELKTLVQDLYIQNNRSR